jgi:hypothetical protein
MREVEPCRDDQCARGWCEGGKSRDLALAPYYDPFWTCSGRHLTAVSIKSSSALQKTLNLFEKLRQARVIFQKNMILARQCNEPGSRYPRCDFTAQFDRDHDVIPDMYDERRRRDPRQKGSNVKVAHGLIIANGAFR